MLFLLLACSASDDRDEGSIPTPCDTQTAYRARAIAPCNASAPAMQMMGPAAQCKDVAGASENLTWWLERVMPQFEAHCHADVNCRAAFLRHNRPLGTSSIK